MLQWFVTSCVLIIIILLLRFFLRKSISLQLRYAMWLIVLVRLLVPVNLFSSPVSVMNVVQPHAPTVKIQHSEVIHTPEISTSQQPADTFASQVTTAPSYPATIVPEELEDQDALSKQIPEEDTTSSRFSAGQLLNLIWVCGVFAAASVFILSNILLAVRLKRTRQEENADCSVRVYRTKIIDAPCLFGVFRPAIYLTSDAAEDDGRHHILAHEMMHYKHLDHIWGALRCICLVLHWYNPLVWLAVVLSRRDGELACDEAVIKRLGEENRIEYGKTLIRMTCTKRAHSSIFTAATTMISGKKTLIQRIKLIAKHPKTAACAVICLVLVVAVAVGCTFTGAKSRKTADSEITTNETDSADTVPLQPEETAQHETTEEPSEEEFPVLLECADAEGFVTQKSLDTGIPCRVFVNKYRNNDINAFPYDLYVEIETETGRLTKLVERNVIWLPYVNLHLADIDGDSVQEILIQYDTGGVGGFGSWVTFVLKADDNKILVLFDNYNEFNTGFENQFLKDYKLKVTNRFTDYNLVFDLKEHYKNIYDNAKEPPSGYPMLLDSFYYFEPEDVDHDGISEIVCKQYTSILTHVDYVGSACCVLKYNERFKKFEVVDAWYEPYFYLENQ